MLKTKVDPVWRPLGSDALVQELPIVNFTLFFDTARRQWPTILVTLSLVFGMAVIYFCTSPAHYTAAATVLIDTHQNQFAQSAGDTAAVPSMMDPGVVDSEVEVLKSESVALVVISELGLPENRNFMSPPTNIFVSLLRSISSRSALSEFEKRRQAVANFARDLEVKRTGTAYAIEVSFNTVDATLSAQIVNHITDAYISGELNAKYQATKKASKWLQDRLSELRSEAMAADQLVQNFKSDNNIVDTTRGSMGDQQIDDVSTQLISARAATSDAKAKLDRIQQIAADDLPNSATVKDALNSDVINRLRAQYLDLAAKESDWSARYGANHQAAVILRNQMEEIKKSISNELGRIAETYKSDYQIALAREQSLQQSLGQLVGQASATGQAQIKLHDLESKAQAFRSLYDTFLQRFTEATQQQSFPNTDARVITEASQPVSPSGPKGFLILPGGVLVGLIIGFGTALFREFKGDVAFRMSRRVEEELGVVCLGVLPRVRLGRPSLQIQSANLNNNRALKPEVGLGHYVLASPYSRFTETIRGVGLALDDLSSHGCGVIGLVSSVPKEGKSLLAVNLAVLMADGGKRVLLIDVDTRDPSLSATLSQGGSAGLMEILREEGSLDDFVRTDPITGFDFLPVGSVTDLTKTLELLKSENMNNLFQTLRKSYDYVLLDLPPVLPVVDVRTVTPLVDGFLFVIEWGSTSREVVRNALRTSEGLRSRLIGAVLNKADPVILKRIEAGLGLRLDSYAVSKAKVSDNELIDPEKRRRNPRRSHITEPWLSEGVE